MLTWPWFARSDDGVLGVQVDVLRWRLAVTFSWPIEWALVWRGDP